MLDLGPGGDVRGGEVVAQGTPENVAAVEGSYTGQYLKPLLDRATWNERALAKAGAEGGCCGLGELCGSLT